MYLQYGFLYLILTRPKFAVLLSRLQPTLKIMPHKNQQNCTFMNLASVLPTNSASSISLPRHKKEAGKRPLPQMDYEAQVRNVCRGETDLMNHMTAHI
jgi:hypothetical protein